MQVRERICNNTRGPYYLKVLRCLGGAEEEKELIFSIILGGVGYLRRRRKRVAVQEKGISVYTEVQKRARRGRGLGIRRMSRRLANKSEVG